MLFLFPGRMRFSITFEDKKNVLYFFFQCSLSHHLLKRDTLSMHTRVRLVIFGTFLSISFVLNERVRTNLFFYLWLVIAYSYKRYRTTSLNEIIRIDKSQNRLKRHVALFFFFSKMYT